MPELFGVRVFTSVARVGRKRRRRGPPATAASKALEAENAALKRQIAAARSLQLEAELLLVVLQPVGDGSMFLLKRSACEKLAKAIEQFEESRRAKG